MTGASGNRIRRQTRRKIFDHVSLEDTYWAGRLDDVAFLQRVFDLTELPSHDSRFHDAESDIWQHRINNNDWENDWIFADPRFDLMGTGDEKFLQFLCQMIHPVVRPATDEAESLADAFNEALRPDGYELVIEDRIGKRPIWGAVELSLSGAGGQLAIRAARTTFDAEYIQRQIGRIEQAIEGDPALAIGTAKELVESTLRAVLEARAVNADTSADIAKLMRLVQKQLRLVPDEVTDAAKAADSVRRVLGSLATVVQGMAELRNAYGSGHGHAPSRRGLTSRHARLAAGAASTLCVFLWETHVALISKPEVSRG